MPSLGRMSGFGTSHWALSVRFEFDGIVSIAYRYYDRSSRFCRRFERSPNAKWSAAEVRLLRKLFPKTTRRETLRRFPGRTWWAIEGKARGLGLRRPSNPPLSKTLYRQVDIGYSAGMTVADGSIMERLFSSGSRRGRLEGGGERRARWYSMPYVEVSMEDKDSLNRLGRIWVSAQSAMGKVP
jgi:hypothetical protein